MKCDLDGIFSLFGNLIVTLVGRRAGEQARNKIVVL
jgi:hypothetical protein